MLDVHLLFDSIMDIDALEVLLNKALANYHSMDVSCIISTLMVGLDYHSINWIMANHSPFIAVLVIHLLIIFVIVIMVIVIMDVAIVVEAMLIKEYSAVVKYTNHASSSQLKVLSH